MCSHQPDTEDTENPPLPSTRLVNGGRAFKSWCVEILHHRRHTIDNHLRLFFVCLFLCFRIDGSAPVVPAHVLFSFLQLIKHHIASIAYTRTEQRVYIYNIESKGIRHHIHAIRLAHSAALPVNQDNIDIYLIIPRPLAWNFLFVSSVCVVFIFETVFFIIVFFRGELMSFPFRFSATFFFTLFHTLQCPMQLVLDPCSSWISPVDQ